VPAGIPPRPAPDGNAGDAPARGAGRAGRGPAAPAAPGAAPTAPGGAPPAGQPPEAPGAGQPPAPDAGQPPAPAAGLGGVLGAPQSAMNMFGDISPLPHLTALQTPGFRPPPPPEPPPSPGRSSRHARPRSCRASGPSRSPTTRPHAVDRVTYSFNFFDYLNQSVNERINVPLSRIQAYRHIFGFEKTLFDKNASFGMRLPLNTVTANSTLPNYGQTKTALGDLTAYFKYALWIDREQGRVLSTGLAVTMPTGPTAFAGAPYLRGLHYTTLQPFLGFQWTEGNWYFINFNSIDIPTSSRDVTMIYNDLSLGYFVYRNPDANGFLQSVAPTSEVHINSPLNHNHPFNFRDIAATSEVVNLTQGLNIFFRNKSVLSMGVVTPVTGPRPFSIEALALYNVFF